MSTEFRLPPGSRFGRYAGETLEHVVVADRDYSRWLIAQPFFADSYPVLRAELQRLAAEAVTAEHAAQRGFAKP